MTAAVNLQSNNVVTVEAQRRQRVHTTRAELGTVSDAGEDVPVAEDNEVEEKKTES
jgi:hypothetical protein